MKQKALLCCVLALTLLLTLLPAVALDHPTEVLTPLDEGQFLLGMVAHQGRLLIRSSQGLYAWTEETGLEEIARLPDPFLEETPNFANLLSDGEQLYGFHPFQGRLYPLYLAEGVEFGEAIQLNVQDLAISEGLAEFLLPPEQVLLHAGRVYLLYTEYNSSQSDKRLLSFNLLGEDRKEHPADSLLAIAPYDNGQLLLLIERESGILAPAGIDVLDPVTNEITALRTLQEPYEFGGNALLHDPESGLIYYQSGNRLLAVNPQGAEHLVARLAGDFMSSNAGIHLLSPGLIAFAHLKGISIRQTVPPQTNQQTLTLYGTWQDDGHERAALILSDVDIDLIEFNRGGPGLIEKLITGDKDFDIAFVMADSLDTRAITDKGYAVDLSGSKILNEHISRLYPSLQALVGSPPRLIPVKASMEPMYYNRGLFLEAGLDVPTSLEEWLDFINGTAWQNSGFPLFDYALERHQLLNMAVTLWTARAVAKNEIPQFSDLDFLRVMEQVQRYQSPPRSFEDIGMVRAFFQFGNELNLEYWSSDRNWNGDHEPLFLSFFEGETALPQLNVQLAFINPHSQNQEAALRYLEARVLSLRAMWQYFLYTDKTQALEDPNHEMNLRRMQSFLDALEKQMLEAEGARKSDLEQQLIASQQNYDDNKEKSRYLISAEIAQELNALMQKAVVMDARMQQVYEANVIAIFNRALSGQVSLQDAAREADGRLQLMAKESE